MNRHLPSARPAGGPHLGLPPGLCEAVIWRKRQGWEGWGPHPGAEASEGPCVPAGGSGLGTPGAPLLFRRQDAHRNRGAEKGKLGTPDPPPHLGRRLAVPKAPPAGRRPGRGAGRLGSVVGPAHRRPGRAVGLGLFSSGRVRMALEAGRPRAPPPGRARAGRWLNIWGLGSASGGERGGGRVHVAGSLGASLGRVRQAGIRVRTGIRVRGPVSERPPGTDARRGPQVRGPRACRSPGPRRGRGRGGGTRPN